MILLESAIIFGSSLIFLGLLYSYYKPKINQIEKIYNDLNSKLKDKLENMTSKEREDFLSSIPKDTKQFYNDIINNNMEFSGISQLSSMRRHIQNTYLAQDIDDMNNFQFQQFTQWAMDESMKAVTPFDHGGYVQGPGFNPSDTMHQEMNNMNFGMNDSMDFSSHNSFNDF